MNVSIKTSADLKKPASQQRDWSARDAVLWDSFRKGNREALNVIFDSHVRLLFAYGRKITLDHALVSDCIQDLFVELWTKRELVTPQIQSIRHYLMKSIRRRILRRLSADHRVIGQAIPEEYCGNTGFNIELDMIEAQTSGDIARRVKASVSRLSKGQQEAIYLKFYENLTYEQIASVMDTNVKAVYNLISRSLASLRKVLKTYPSARD